MSNGKDKEILCFYKYNFDSLLTLTLEFKFLNIGEKYNRVVNLPLFFYWPLYLLIMRINNLILIIFSSFIFVSKDSHILVKTKVYIKINEKM